MIVEIKRQGVEITGVPGVERIAVTETSIGVQVLVEYSAVQGGLSYGVEGLAEHIEALQVALKEARQMAGVPTVNPFAAPDEIEWRIGQRLTTQEQVDALPLGTVLRDREDDEWCVCSDGLHLWATDEQREVKIALPARSALKYAPLRIEKLGPA